MITVPNHIAMILVKAISEHVAMYTPEQFEEIIRRINEAFPPVEIP